MLRKRKEPKPKKSIADAPLRDIQGTAAEKLAASEKLRARGAFDGMDRRELMKIENILRSLRRWRRPSGYEVSVMREGNGFVREGYFVRSGYANVRSSAMQ
jgi:hypothetical protein